MKKKKILDFELNLIPFINLLSTCICFLLVTAVWVHIGSLSVKQAVGGQPASETEKKATAWIFIEKDGAVVFDVRDSRTLEAKMRKSTVPAKEGKMDLETVTKLTQDLKQVDPTLRTALIQPKAETSYEDIIDLMDTVKRAGLGDLGVVPL